MTAEEIKKDAMSRALTAMTLLIEPHPNPMLAMNTANAIQKIYREALDKTAALSAIESPAREKFIAAAERFAKSLLENDCLDAMHEDEVAESVYQAATAEYNLSKRLMGEAYAATLIRRPTDGTGDTK